MFTLPEEDEQLTTTEKVYFFMPTGDKGELSVTFNFYDEKSYRQLVEDSGKREVEKKSLKISSKLSQKDVPEDELLAAIEEQMDLDLYESDLAILEEAIVDVVGLYDKKGKPIQYSKELLPRVIKFKQPRIALMDSFVSIHSEDGRKKAKRKN